MLEFSVRRTIIGISAALTMSAVTLGATISPAHAGATQPWAIARG